MKTSRFEELIPAIGGEASFNSKATHALDISSIASLM